jgi:hypothetical protein
LDDDLLLYLDGAPHLQVARGGGIPGQLRGLFARLDADMDEGIEFEGQRITAPDAAQRARFVLGHVLQVLADGKVDFARSLLIYVASRQPDLRAVWVRGDASEWTVELDFR